MQIKKKWNGNINGFVKSRKMFFSVIPAKAGIQYFQSIATTLDSGFYRSDDFLRNQQYLLQTK